jgi:hypothetical protein
LFGLLSQRVQVVHSVLISNVSKKKGKELGPFPFNIFPGASEPLAR